MSGSRRGHDVPDLNEVVSHAPTGAKIGGAEIARKDVARSLDS